MKKSLKITIGALACAGVVYSVFAHAISYLALTATFSPNPATIGPSGDATVTGPVVFGSNITFDLKYAIVVQGSTTNFGTGKLITFGAETELKPSGAADVAVAGINSHTFLNAASNFTDSVTFTAPTTPGMYRVKIKSTGGTGGMAGLLPGNGISISFTVADPPPPCEPLSTVLTVPQICVVLHDPNAATLTATLTDENGDPVVGKTVTFKVDGIAAGSGVTDATGLATSTTPYNVSGLSVGDHEVEAIFTAPDDACDYLGTSGVGNLGVTYLFIGFEQPINADGSSIFKGGAIPVKIRLSDSNGTPVTDAEAHVFFSQNTSAIVGDEAEPIANTNGDSGNLMRYDPVADQYIFNWDLKTVDNGTYKVWIELGEGACGEQHNVVLSVAKIGKGVKK
jgi:hypothetical protein